MSRPGVFLDRDGVLNASVTRAGRPHPPSSADEVELLPGVEGALRAFADAGLPLIVVTNQPDIARGTATLEDVDAINARLRAALPIDEIVVCPHDDPDDCACRKPRPGMLVDAAARWDIDLPRSVMVGDRWRDIEAGRAAGTATVFIDRDYDERAPSAPDLTIRELPEGVTWIIHTATRRS